MEPPIRIDWPGRTALRPPEAGPKWRAVERFGPDASCVRLCHGDNLEALAGLVPEYKGCVGLVYLDPPFGTGRRFAAADGAYVAYEDRFEGGVAGLLSMLEPRLRLVAELLAPTGSLYVHVDPIAVHPVKLLLDEILGPRCFQREIVWRIGWISGFKAAQRNWVRNHDTILFYTKHPTRFTFHKVYVPHRPGYRRRGGGRGGRSGVAVGDVWNAGPEDLALEGAASLDSIQIKSLSREKTGYATQKNESLLARIVGASSNEGDVVLDPFCGSGTTLAVAARMGRRAVGIDASPVAVDVVRRRILTRERTGLTVQVPGNAVPRVRSAPLGVRVCNEAEGAVSVRLETVRDGAGGEVPDERVGGWAVGTVDRDGCFVASAHAMRPLPTGDLERRLGPVRPARRARRLDLEVRVFASDGSVWSRPVRLVRREGRWRRVRDP